MLGTFERSLVEFFYLSYADCWLEWSLILWSMLYLEGWCSEVLEFVYLPISNIHPVIG